MSGDQLFASGIGRTDLPGGDLPRMLESMTNLLAGLPSGSVILMPARWAEGTAAVARHICAEGLEPGLWTAPFLAGVYVRDEVASVVRPVHQLRAYARVTLEPGEERQVALDIPAGRLAFCGWDLRRVVEPGDITVQVGSSCQDIRLRGTVALTGPVRVVGAASRADGEAASRQGPAVRGRQSGGVSQRPAGSRRIVHSGGPAFTGRSSWSTS